MAEAWPEVLEKGEDVAVVFDWLRRKTKGRALAGVLIGTGAVVVTRDVNLSPAEAVALLRREADTIERAFNLTREQRVTRVAVARRD